MRLYASKTELVSASGQHIRYLPALLARSMVAAGAAAIAHQNGKVRSVRLIESTTTHADMIGPPSDGRATGVRFTRRVRLEESATPVIEHHPRCCDYE